jgi:hypothetical protein
MTAVIWITAIVCIGLGIAALLWGVDSESLALVGAGIALVFGPLGYAIWWQDGQDNAACAEDGGHWADDDHLTPIVIMIGKVPTTQYVRGQHCVVPQ